MLERSWALIVQGAGWIFKPSRTCYNCWHNTGRGYDGCELNRIEKIGNKGCDQYYYEVDTF